MNKKIGLVGEDPNDTSSIKNLLIQKYKNLSFLPLVKNKKGYQLDHAQTKRALRVECEMKKPDIVIFIRDADGVYTDEAKINKVKNWFHELSKSVSCSKTLLLNIYELEALIFADIETFNKHYNVSIKGGRDVTYIKEPKEELMHKTGKQKKRYAESHCPELFGHLRIDVISKNCTYFKTFLEEFSELLGDRKN